MSLLESIVSKDIYLGSELIRIHGLGIVPIFSEKAPDIPLVDTLESGLDAGTVRITETSESGEVPFLSLENSGNRPVIVLDGTEVLGGKQNRIINTTLVILVNTSVKIPVSCIQSGRWRQERVDFESGQSIFRAKSRAIQKATVTANVRQSGSYRSDQGAVWREVDTSLQELGVQSSTSDFREGRERVAHRIEEFVQAIRPLENQVGTIFINYRGILGVEILGTHSLFSLVYEKVVRSFAFEVLNAPDLNGTAAEGAKQWWDKILKSPFTRHPSPAAGEDIRVGTGDLIASGLIWNEVLVHFSCFPIVRHEENRRSTKRASARDRQRNLRSSFIE